MCTWLDILRLDLSLICLNCIVTWHGLALIRLGTQYGFVWIVLRLDLDLSKLYWKSFWQGLIACPETWLNLDISNLNIVETWLGLALTWLDTQRRFVCIVWRLDLSCMFLNCVLTRLKTWRALGWLSWVEVSWTCLNCVDTCFDKTWDLMRTWLVVLTFNLTKLCWLQQDLRLDMHLVGCPEIWLNLDLFKLCWD